MTHDFDKKTREKIERWRKEKLIICPHCGHEHEPSVFEDHAPITYWGEDEAEHLYCDECAVGFWVKEHVSRTFKAGKTQDEAESYD